MRVVALISGGKDSCYNMMQCVAAGHEIVALANLQPKEKDELDSYMYQTVGHMGIPLLAEAMELPLYRQETTGHSVNKHKYYEPTEADEVEDLFHLLKTVKEELNIEAVAVGAILSDYQRIRVENVCSRLNLISLAYLWRRDQSELLQEMIDCKINAILIKVAALGLDPRKHLCKTLIDVQGHLQAMATQYGLNVCGEGGEYETFTLDCPLFKRKIKIDEMETVIQSNDPIAPVGYVNFKKMTLVEKTCTTNSITVKNSMDFISDLNSSSYSDLSDPDLSESELELIEKQQNSIEKRKKSNSLLSLDLKNENKSIINNCDKPDNFSDNLCDTSVHSKLENQRSFESSIPLTPFVVEYEKNNIEIKPQVYCNDVGWLFVNGIYGYGDINTAMEGVLKKLINLLRTKKFSTKDLCSVSLYVRDLKKFAELNNLYSKMLNDINPPVRACVEVPLPEGCHVVLDATCFKNQEKTGDLDNIEKQTIHVQGISHWAPANIGPYSQGNRVGEIVHMAGQIGLVPGSMELIENMKSQCKLALRHVSRIAQAMGCTDQLRDVVQAICWVTHPMYITEARRQFERCSNSALVQYVVCSALPRGAAVEWSTWAHRHNKQFQYEETGCAVDDFTVSIRSRWNYEGTVCAAICQLSTGSATSTTHLSEFTNENQKHKIMASSTTIEQIIQTIEYTINKLLKNWHNSEKAIINLKLFYKVDYLQNNLLNKAIEMVVQKIEQNITYNIIPICNLQNFNTFLSICGIIFE